MKHLAYWLAPFLAFSTGALAMPMISEVMSANTKTLKDEDNQFVDWVEISNPTASAITLEKFYLTDDPEDLTKWEFPKISLPGNGYLVVFASSKNRVDPAKKLHTNFGISANGEWVGLVDPDGKKIVSQVSVPPLKDDVSYSLVDASGSGVYQTTDKPSPGLTNQKDVVLFSTRGRTFVEPLKLTLSSPSGGEILYTTNGKKPAAENPGTVYTAPIDLATSAIITVQVNGGPVSQESFIAIDAALADRSSNLPLVVIDSPRAISSQTVVTEMAVGILEPTGADKRAKIVGEFSLNSRGAIRVRGETSASNPKRPYRVEFWDSEGKDRQMDVFGMGAESDWLLNMQQTFDSTLMHNAWIYKMSNEMGQWAAETRYVEVYHNQKADGLVTQTDYVGVYEWMENISLGASRLDLERLPIGYDIRLLTVATEAEIPADGRALAIVAQMEGKLRFRAWDSAGLRVVDVEESALTAQATAITDLKKKLEPLWAAADISAEKAALLSSVTAIAGVSLGYEGRSEPSITGGYVFKQDKEDPKTWLANGGGVAIQIIAPAEEEKIPRKHQQDWLVAHLNKVRTATTSADYKTLIDERAWIDHHWLGFLPLNVDALRLSAYFYKDRGELLKAGPIWDFDRSAGGQGDDRVTKANVWRATTGDLGTHFFGAANGTPVWWVNLFKVPDFQAAWVDRYWELRKSHFALENINRIIDDYATELNEAQARNFTKWTSPRPRGGYPAEIGILKTWLKTRVEWLDSQMITVPKYTPAEVVHDSEINLSVDATGGSVTPAIVYYTLDGTDPRAPGGAPSDKATLYDGKPIILTKSAKIFARKHDPEYKQHKDGPMMKWSGPALARYFVGTEPARASNLVVSEIMYNPENPTNVERAAGFTEADAFEFIELANVGSKPVDLGGARVSDGVDYRFPDGTMLDPGKRLVLAANSVAFARRYGQIALQGIYSGSLRNGGEEIVVRDYQDNVIASFDFDDAAPWPTSPDGNGNSLVLKSPNAKPDPSLVASWVASSAKKGSPGTTDPAEGQAPPPAGYTGWLTSNFSAAQQADAAISGPQADADKDGLPTLAEYFAGGNPLKADPARAPKATLETAGGAEQFLTFTYVKATAVTDVKAQVELSADLKTWVSGDQVLAVKTTANGDGTTTIVVRAAQPFGQAGQRFARLRVTK